MGQRVKLFGKTFCIKSGLNVEHGKGFCRVVSLDPKHNKRKIERSISNETSAEKLISIDVINSNWEEFVIESEKPDFSMKEWLLKKLPQSCSERDYLTENKC